MAEKREQPVVVVDGIVERVKEENVIKPILPVLKGYLNRMKSVAKERGRDPDFMAGFSVELTDNDVIYYLDRGELKKAFDKLEDMADKNVAYKFALRYIRGITDVPFFNLNDEERDVMRSILLDAQTRRGIEEFAKAWAKGFAAGVRKILRNLEEAGFVEKG